MKKLVLLTALSFSYNLIFAQTSGLNGLLKKASSTVSGTNNTSGSSLSTDQIVQGLKEALNVGAQNSTSKLSAADGFFKDAAVKILMPEEAKKVESTLRSMGMGKLVDDAILSVNRAAEDASKTAAPIFLNAVKGMSVKDALGVLQGADTAATSYLRKTTNSDLTSSFKPVIEQSLQKTNATKYWSEVFSAYNKVSFKKVDPDLTNYVTTKALNGIFYYVGEEEKKIRTNPTAQITDILKQVFGRK
ncbi:DUF4197 domain-containing protein [Pinibacter soli]|uniref:DUF4197 domain-containing protein n=1 Tax=Pinibacter soli TaxID=3044211 RepID=A0ABT6RGU9_9BACT|nr:DUF4197 domain-containing protein [Pinibacter soli]MDI3321799.1 DUF4197 domain-containing protein [Pinibacter soli]